MCNNLITKSKAEQSAVYVFDTYQPALEEATSNGAVAVDSVSDLPKHCDVIITMLRSDQQVQSVYSQMLSQSLKDDTLLIDSSTVNYLTSRDIAARIPSNASILDAPVSGGIGAAAAGSLTFMCGGSQTAFERAKTVLGTMGMNVVHCGEEHGSGQIAKICNNLILAISMCAVSEGMNLGVKLGMDPQKLSDIVNVSSGGCWSSAQYNPCPGVTLLDAEGKPKLVS